VERALQLLPDAEALRPLRALLLRVSRPLDPFSSAGDLYRTLGKRQLEPGDLRAGLSQALAGFTTGLIELYQSAIAVIEAEGRADPAASVRALLRAGQCEQRAGRLSQARLWFDHALSLAEALHDRRPEIQALDLLGRLEWSRGQLDRSGRCFQRSLAVAEAERDRDGAARACQGLGDVALAQDQHAGAESWYTRGLGYAVEDRELAASLTLSLAEVATQRDQLEIAASRLRRAREAFEELQDGDGLTRALVAEGHLEAARGHTGEAVNRLREALRRSRRPPGHPVFEMAVRLDLCQVYLGAGRLPDVEDEVRRAEEVAIMHNLTAGLIRLYLLMGEVFGRQGDENGFVFFENAVTLCRGAEPARDLEAESYLKYARFRLTLGDRAEARACLERARELLAALGATGLQARVDRELADLAPA
jgi:tetratricopeptide (TPR) repeat protein